MTLEEIYLTETDSTNRWLAEHSNGRDMVVRTGFQTAGRGCGSNQWESEREKNLLFSVVIHPAALPAAEQFRISMAISLAIVRALLPIVQEGLSIKWPNDIYWQNHKLGGILIEQRLKGAEICESIIGVGLNVNQTVFLSNAPNPISLKQIAGREYQPEKLLTDILEQFTLDINAFDYRQMLYRKEGFYPYSDRDGVFGAEMVTVEDSGHLILRDHEGRLRRYAFKEVSFVI